MSKEDESISSQASEKGARHCTPPWQNRKNFPHLSHSTSSAFLINTLSFTTTLHFQIGEAFVRDRMALHVAEMREKARWLSAPASPPNSGQYGFSVSPQCPILLQVQEAEVKGRCTAVAAITVLG
jgi:hypothetical protein